MIEYNHYNSKVIQLYKKNVYNVFDNSDFGNHKLFPEIKHILDSPGKMIRSTFAYITHSLKEEKSHQSLIQLIIIIELIQAASVIHDDIIDKSLYRRGKKTVFSEYGLDAALLLGDYFIFAVMKLISDMDADSDKKDDLLSSISRCLLNMYEGQRAESMLVGNCAISEEDYVKIVGNKTATFVSMSCELGAILAGADSNYRKWVKSYGYNIGIAYQMMDDLKSILYLYDTGRDKSYQTDFERRLVTLPVIIAFRCADQKGRTVLTNHYLGYESNSDVVISLITSDMVISEVKGKIASYIIKAKEELNCVKNSKYRTALIEYCDSFMEEIE